MGTAVKIFCSAALAGSVILLFSPEPGRTAETDHKTKQELFQTSDRCFACHNTLSTSAGEDISIGFAWRASMMANSSRDPYWQAGVRREVLDHSKSRALIEDECSRCHMPMANVESRLRKHEAEVFSHLDF